MNWEALKIRLTNAVRDGGSEITVTVTLACGKTITGKMGLNAPIKNWATGEIHLIAEKRSADLFHIISVDQIAACSVHL